jgi:hypothetical protein
MNLADLTGVMVIVIFVAIGYFMGTIRSVASMLGVIAAFKVADALYVQHADANKYCMTFLGIYLLATIIGILFYGKTRTTLIDALEGVFGAIAGLVVGWGMARFIFSVALFYNGTSEFAHLVSTGLVSMDIYMISPLAFMMDNTTSLRNPKIF